MAKGSAPDFDVFTSREGSDQKTYYTRIGSAWKVAKGGVSIQFDALPISDKDGKCKAVMFPPKDE